MASREEVDEVVDSTHHGGDNFVVSWVMWGSGSDPQQGSVFPNPDSIVILGGGDLARWSHGHTLANEYPSVPVLVTRVGGVTVVYLKQNATSTVENAKFTRPILDALGEHQVILVTN